MKKRLKFNPDCVDCVREKRQRANRSQLVERIVGTLNGGAKSSQHPALCKCPAHQPYWRVARRIAAMKVAVASMQFTENGLEGPKEIRILQAS